MDGKRFFVLFVLACLVLLTIVSAITGSIGNGRMVLRVDVGETIEKYVLVKNVNNVSVNISVTASGDLEKYVTLRDEEFTLQPESEKKAYFTIKANKAGTFETKIQVAFKPAEGTGAGVGLSSSVILIAGGSDEELPDDTEDTIDTDSENIVDSENNSTNPATNLLDNLSNSSGKTKLLLLLSIPTIILVVIFILLISKLKSKKEKEEVLSNKGVSRGRTKHKKETNLNED